MNDWQLLEEYAANGSETAFRALADRHVNLVYSAALRQASNPQLAEEICQSVFVLLARKAGSLKRDTILAGWLFRTTRFVSAHAHRTEQRRRRREQEAFEMQQLAASDPDWSRLAPMLDEAMEQLGETDRNILLLRFFEDRNYRETGAALGLNEDAARKRTTRALEKLRGFFAERGLRVSATALATGLTAHAVKGAPVSLAGKVAAAGCLGGSAVSASLPALAQDVLKLWRWSRIKLMGSLAAGLLMVIALSFLLAHPQPPEPSRIATLPSPPSGSAVTSVGALAATASTRTPIPEQRVRILDGQVLRLHVIAKDTHEPVVNAELAVNTVTGGAWRQRYDLFTDASGTAEVPYPTDTTRLDVGVLSAGWAARFVTWIPARDDFIPQDYTLQVEPVTQSMGGWLRDMQGQPVAGAEITVDFEGTGDATDRETPRERFGFLGGTRPVVARTDSQGWWTCAIIPPQNPAGFTLEARHPGFRSTTLFHGVAATNQDDAARAKRKLLLSGKLVTRMARGLILTGRVLDEHGNPIGQATVAHEPFTVSSTTVHTDSKGQFAIRNLAHRDFDFTVTAPGFAPEYRNVDVRQDMDPLEIQLQPGALLRLRLVDEHGQAVTGAKVVLEQWGHYRQKLKWAAESGADGRIEWQSAPRQGQLELAAFKEGWCYSRNLRFIADGREHLITMRRALTLSGYVTDAQTGQPISQFRAYPGYGKGKHAWERSETRHGTDGNLTVCFQERKDPWRVRIEAPGYVTFTSDPLATDFAGPLNVALHHK